MDLLVSAVNKAVKSSARPIIFGISPQANIDKDRDELFADVESTKYYAEAVRWAVANGVTKGVSDTSFAPGSACTRAQIVTFLYRDCMNE